MRVWLSDMPPAAGREAGECPGTAHASSVECPHALETALHLAAKDILAERREIELACVEVLFREDSTG